MAEAEEPHFQPLAPDEDNIRPVESPGTVPTGQSYGTGPQSYDSQQTAPMASGWHAGPTRETATHIGAPVPRGPETGTGIPHGSVTPLPPPPAEERIRTSLDSAWPVPVTPGPEVPSGGGPSISALGEDRNASRTPTVSPLPWRPGNAGAENTSRTARSTSPPVGPTPTSAQRPAHGAGSSGANPTPAGRTPTSTVGGPPVGQGPIAGRPPMSGFPAAGGNSTRDPGAGILGGVPRQAAPQTRQAPRGGVISTHTTPAVRDPATGMVHGPGGAPVSRLPSGARTPPAATRQRENPADARQLPAEGR
jgi:hypothetical protein